MKKINMLLDMCEAFDTNSYIVVAVKTPDTEKPELIINSPENIKSKMKYYAQNYNEFLELNKNKDVKIINYARGKSYMEALVNITHKLEGVK